MPRPITFAKALRAERGYTLIELLVAVLIALFLLGGLVTMVAGTRRTNGSQSALAQLQDNERIAMTLMNSIVQKAGYFPDPTNQTYSNFTAETFNSVNLASSQIIGGTYNSSAPGDTFMVRFYTPPLDTNGAVINCAGQSNTSASKLVWYTNEFQVAQVNGTWWLQCLVRTSGAGNVLTVNLIPNVTSISVLYGVGSSSAGDDYSVLQYLNAGQMSSTNWFNVTSVKITLTFLLPSLGTVGGQMSTATTTFQRVIPLMARGGVDT